MRFSIARRSRWSLGSLLGRKSKARVSVDDQSQTIEIEQDGEDIRTKCGISAPPDAAEVDVLRARGFMTHSRNYKPPSDLESKLAEIIKKWFSVGDSNADTTLISSSSNWKNVDFSDKIDQKFKILAECERILGKRVHNSNLHEINSGLDIWRYYLMETTIVAPYNRLARGLDAEKPRNLHIIEECIRYDPIRDGPPALPKHQGRTHSLRFGRMYRPVKCPTEWHELARQKYRSFQEPKFAPWRPEVDTRHDSLTLKHPKFAP